MRKFAYLPFLLLIVSVSFFDCKKNWPAAEQEIFKPVEGPTPDDLFNEGCYDIIFGLSSDSLKVGSDIEANVEVNRNDGKFLDVDYFYRWEMVFGVSLTLRYSNYGYIRTNINLFRPALNDAVVAQGFNLYNVNITTTDSWLKRWFVTEELRLNAVKEFEKLSISLKIGYEKSDGSIRFFCKKFLYIPIYY
ncbi:hypothetical protein ACFL4T_04425 [candidate division KSB1 bacterium]